MKDIINVGDVVLFCMNKGDERYGKEITGIVQVIVKQSFGTYFMIGDGTQYYIDWIDDLIVLKPKEQKQVKFTRDEVMKWNEDKQAFAGNAICNFIKEYNLLSSDE